MTMKIMSNWSMNKLINKKEKNNLINKIKKKK